MALLGNGRRTRAHSHAQNHDATSIVNGGLAGCVQHIRSRIISGTAAVVFQPSQEEEEVVVVVEEGYSSAAGVVPAVGH